MVPSKYGTHHSDHDAHTNIPVSTVARKTCQKPRTKDYHSKRWDEGFVCTPTAAAAPPESKIHKKTRGQHHHLSRSIYGWRCRWRCRDCIVPYYCHNDEGTRPFAVAVHHIGESTYTCMHA